MRLRGLITYIRVSNITKYCLPENGETTRAPCDLCFFKNKNKMPGIRIHKKISMGITFCRLAQFI